MSKQARTTLALLSAILGAATLQAAPLPGFAVKAETEHFTFYSRDNQKVDATKSERYLAEVERLLGQQIAGRAEYYRYETPQEVAAGTGTYATGLTFPKAGQIHSTEAFHAHEIVHLVAGQMGDPGAFFQEGLAVALGNDARWQGKDVHKVARDQANRLSVRAMVEGFERMEADTAYALAGSFVARLIQTHGIEKVAAFFRACSGRNTAAAFVRTFGQSLEEAGASWSASL